MPNYKRYYLENRYIFITVVTYNRNHILVKNIDLLRECFKNAKDKFGYELFGSVILPNHFHIIIKTKEADEFSKTISYIKRNFTQSIDEDIQEENISKSRINRHEKGIWQRRFYEHIIRDEEDLYKHLDYIHYNPVKHNYVESVKDWQFSSFSKFVKLNNYDINWGSPLEIKHIESMNYD